MIARGFNLASYRHYQAALPAYLPTYLPIVGRKKSILSATEQKNIRR